MSGQAPSDYLCTHKSVIWCLSQRCGKWFAFSPILRLSLHHARRPYQACLAYICVFDCSRSHCSGRNQSHSAHHIRGIGFRPSGEDGPRTAQSRVIYSGALRALLCKVCKCPRARRFVTTCLWLKSKNCSELLFECAVRGPIGWKGPTA